MLISNIRSISHENQVLMVDIFEGKGILRGLDNFSIGDKNDYFRRKKCHCSQKWSSPTEETAKSDKTIISLKNQKCPRE